METNNENIVKGLEQDAQLKSERIPMTATQIEATKIAERLKAWIAEHKFSQEHVAKMIGCSNATINQFLANKYAGRLDVVINKVVQLMESVSRKERRTKTGFIETSVAKSIAALITQTEAFSDDEGKIGLIIGDGGHGKSECLRQFSKANRNTIYVELDSAMTGTTMFAEIAKSLNIDSSGNIGNITRRLISALEFRHLIVMLDEASSLTVTQLNQLRQIIVVKSKCPLILSGNNDLLKTVMQPTTRRGFESLDQFTSRLSYILNLDAKSSDKDGGLYTVEDIRKLYEYGGVRLTGDAIKTLRKMCATPRSGRLRTCSHIISALHTSAAIRKLGQIDSVSILSALEELGLPVRAWLPVWTKSDDAEEKEQQQIAKAG